MAQGSRNRSAYLLRLHHRRLPRAISASGGGAVALTQLEIQLEHIDDPLAEQPALRAERIRPRQRLNLLRDLRRGIMD